MPSVSWLKRETERGEVKDRLVPGPNLVALTNQITINLSMKASTIVLSLCDTPTHSSISLIIYQPKPWQTSSQRKKESSTRE